MDSDNGTITRQTILAAALRVFADRGYDGARMDEIARTGAVNKSLIYYYFKSKREIFEVLVTGFVSDLFTILEPALKPELFDDTHTIEKAFEMMFGFLEERTDMVSLLVTETIKKGSEEVYLFQLIDRIFSFELNVFDVVFSGKGIPDVNETRDQRIVTEFFTLIGPVILFVVLEHKWARYFQVDRTVLKRQFVSALQKTHVAHHEQEFRDHQDEVG